MAPDAVIGLVQCSGEVGALIGQREAAATPNLLGLDREGGDAAVVPVVVFGDGVVNQVQWVNPGGCLEQHAFVMALPTSLALQCPRCIPEGQVEGTRKRGFVGLPACHVARERQFKGGRVGQ
jgi:hypothetical protein